MLDILGSRSVDGLDQRAAIRAHPPAMVPRATARARPGEACGRSQPCRASACRPPRGCHRRQGIRRERAIEVHESVRAGMRGERRALPGTAVVPNPCGWPRSYLRGKLRPFPLFRDDTLALFPGDLQRSIAPAPQQDVVHPQTPERSRTAALRERLKPLFQNCPLRTT